jgi:hypothetical protein
MSQQYDNTNRWVLFKNERKDKDTSPDYTGTLNVDGVEYFLDAWLKDGKNGGKFFSGRIKRKDKQQMRGLADDLRSNSPQAPARGRAPANDIDDSIPF